MADGTLYLYLDESGNFDFSENGTDYFIMTGVAMRRPFECAKSLLSYKYDCIEAGAKIERFHACEDSDRVRTGVLDVIEKTCGGHAAYSAMVRKPLLPRNMKKLRQCTHSCSSASSQKCSSTRSTARPARSSS